MLKFGKSAPRAADSFGVASLLAEECRVYYSSLFSTHHVGRVSDLFTAILREHRIDELKFRLLILLGAFEAFQTQAKATGLSEEGSGRLENPIVAECGVDDEKIAIGFAFNSDAGIEAQNLSERIVQRRPNGAFERLLCRIFDFSDRLVIRIVPGAKVEVISLLGIPNKISVEELKNRQPPWVVVSDEERVSSGAEGLVAREYIELGDVDYSSLLRPDGPGLQVAAPSSGEVLFDGCTELEKAMRVRGGASAKPDEPIRVGGGDGNENQDLQVIRSSRGDLMDQTLLRVQGNGEGQSESQDKWEISGDGQPEKPGFKGLLQKVWSLRKKIKLPAGEAASASAVEEKAGKEQAVSSSSLAAPADKDQEKQVLPRTEAGQTESELAQIISQIEDEASKDVLKNAKEKSGESQPEIENVKAKAWVDGMVSELLAEKAKISELTKKMTMTIRQRELEFKRKEVTLQQELQSAEKTIRLKNTALDHAKSQLSQLQLNMEKLKGNSGSKVEEEGIKRRQSMSQKLLSLSKEENARLTARIEELRSQLAVAQMAAKSKTATSSPPTEVSGLKLKNERLMRQSEELRKLNEQLSDRIKQITEKMEKEKKSASAESTGDLAKRLEASMKRVSGFQKENEQLKLAVDELRREEDRLRAELKRAQLEGKNAKIPNPGSSGGTGGRGRVA